MDLRIFTLYLACQALLSLRMFHTFMVNNCNITRAHSLILWRLKHVYGVSSVTSDNVGSWQGRTRRTREPKIFSQCLRFTQIEQRPCTECLCSSVNQLFQCFTSSTTAEKQVFSSIFCLKNITISISRNWTVSYCITLN